MDALGVSTHKEGAHAFSHLPDLDLPNRAAHEEIVAGLLDGSLCILPNKQSPVTKHCMPGLQGSFFRDGAPFGGQLRPWYLSGRLRARGLSSGRVQKLSVRLEFPAGFRFVWALYVIPDDGRSFPEWTVSSDNRGIWASRPFQRVPQVAKLPQEAPPAMEAVFDLSAGCYPFLRLGRRRRGLSTHSATYKEGRCRCGKLLAPLFPHHVESLDTGYSVL